MTSERVCTVEDCGKQYLAKGLCQLHYQRENAAKCREYTRRWRLNNIDRARALNRKADKARLEKRKPYKKAARLVNPAKTKEMDRKYHLAADPIKVRERDRARRDTPAKRERLNAQSRARRLADPTRTRSTDKLRYATDPEYRQKKIDRAKARHDRMGGAKPHRWWPELASRQGGKCGLCGKALRLESDAIDVDHIEPDSLGGPTTKANCQATHKSCNASKGNKIVPQNLVLL